MERTIVTAEFKGGIWHRFFTAAKKDATLASILDEKIRFYSLYYPFLEKKQIAAKAYKELDIPHICGEVNRKELYKLFLKERNNQYKYKEKYKKYPTLLIENKSRNKHIVKKPTILTTKQIKVNNVHTEVEKTKQDHVFDSLLPENVSPKRKEGMLNNINLKQTKSVRFNDGIEVHSVSPSMPMYKLKPLGRLFGEPSALRNVDNQANSQQELEETIDDSDSDFDADTGITSDAEDYDLQDPPQIEDSNKNTETADNGKVEENRLLNGETKTSYDCSEDDVNTTDEEISKEGNDLILTSRMITVVQGKWVKETKQIIGNTNHAKYEMISNRDEFESVKNDDGDERQESDMMNHLEHVLEKIKSLCISNKDQGETSSDTIFSIGGDESELNIIKANKEQLIVGNIKVEEGLTGIEMAIIDKNEPKKRQKELSKIENSKIISENISTNLIDQNWSTIDNNKASCEHDLSEMKSNEEQNRDKRIRTKPIKLVDDLIDYINDWDSRRKSSLNSNVSQTLSIKPTHTDSQEKYDCIKKNKDSDYLDNDAMAEPKANEIKEVKHVMDNVEDMSDKDEDNLKDSFVIKKTCLKEQTSSPQLSVKDDQLVSSQPIESSKFPNTMSISPRTEHSPSYDKLESPRDEKTENETQDFSSQFHMPFSLNNEILDQKEFQINNTSTIIRSMVSNQSISNPNEVFSTFYSLITEPILIQSQYMEEDLDLSNSSLAAEQKEKESEDNSSKLFIADKKLLRDKHENTLDDVETTEMYEGHIAIESETNSTNFLSKVHMWSLHSKTYSENLTMASQTSSVQAVCNTDSLQRNVVVLDDIIKTEDNQNNVSHKSSSTEDSMISGSNEEDNIFGSVSEELNSTGIDLETGSSVSTLTPVKMEKHNSDEVSTAYETDPETGKLVMNRYLQPVANSTPVKWVDEQQDSVPERRSKENGLEELSSHSYSIKEKDNKCFGYETENKQTPSIYVIDESTEKSEIQFKNINDPPESSSRLSLLDKGNGTETNDVLINKEKQEETREVEINNNKKSDLNDIPQYLIEKHNKILSGTDNPTKQDNNNKSSSLSIIESSQTSSPRRCKKQKNFDNVKPILSHSIGTDPQGEEYMIEGDTAKTEISSMKISSKSDIENKNIFAISETPESSDDQHRNSSEPAGESLIQYNEHRTSRNNVTSNIVAIEKTSLDSHTPDITYNPSSITDDFKVGRYEKTSTVRLSGTGEMEYNISERENYLNISNELITTDNKMRLSAITESIVNDYTESHMSTSGSIEKLQSSNKLNINQVETVFLRSPLRDENSSHDSRNNEMKIREKIINLSQGTEENNIKKNVETRRASMSHVTFLIRDPKPSEDRSYLTESEPEQLFNPSQFDNTEIKQQDRNKEPNKKEILSTVTKTQCMKETNDGPMNETLKPNSINLASDNNSSRFSIGIQDNLFESSLLSSNIDEHKYITRSKTYLSLKRKLGTVYEDDSGSDISLSSRDELSEKEVKMNVSGNIHSRAAGYSESPVTTDTSSIEMNFKRVNTDIRRKRAKLKKENPVKRSSTSSSEDEFKISSLRNEKSLESSILLPQKSKESNIKMKQSNKLYLEDNINSVDLRIQQNSEKSSTNLNDPSMALSSETETNFDSFDKKILKRQNETEQHSISETGQNLKSRGDKTHLSYSISRNVNLSDSSSSIIYSSPNAKKESQGKISETDSPLKSKIRCDKTIKKRQAEEGQIFSDIYNSAKKRNEKSHKSYTLYRRYDSNKENQNNDIKKSNIINPKKPLQQSYPGRSDTNLSEQKEQNYKNPHQNIKKYIKSSIVRSLDNNEASLISNSPEVKTLLRRTYFMGNN